MAAALVVDTIRLCLTKPFHTILQLKQLLSRQAAHDKLSESRKSVGPTEVIVKNSNVTLMDIEPRTSKKVLEPPSKRAALVKVTTDLPPTKKAKTQNFLLAGAKQAKAARSARTAARVGVRRSSTKANQLSNTGSGVPISKVVRLKYVKGFTQAVRTPCRMIDL